MSQIHGTLAFTECCLRIVKAQKTDGYAKAYAQAVFNEPNPTREWIRVQALYILNNIQHWRGDEAKMVRAELKYWAGETK